MSNPQSSGGRPPSLRDLDSRLQAARERDAQARGEREAGPNRTNSAMGYALRVGIELVAGLVVGSLIGWVLDQWFGTTPAMLILFFFLGAGAGIRNVFRTAQEINQAQAAAFEDRNAGAKSERAKPGPDSDRGE